MISNRTMQWWMIYGLFFLVHMQRAGELVRAAADDCYLDVGHDWYVYYPQRVDTALYAASKPMVYLQQLENTAPFGTKTTHVVVHDDNKEYDESLCMVTGHHQKIDIMIPRALIGTIVKNGQLWSIHNYYLKDKLLKGVIAAHPKQRLLLCYDTDSTGTLKIGPRRWGSCASKYVFDAWCDDNTCIVTECEPYVHNDTSEQSQQYQPSRIYGGFINSAHASSSDYMYWVKNGGGTRCVMVKSAQKVATVGPVITVPFQQKELLREMIYLRYCDYYIKKMLHKNRYYHSDRLIPSYQQAAIKNYPYYSAVVKLGFPEFFADDNGNNFRLIVKKPIMLAADVPHECILQCTGEYKHNDRWHALSNKFGGHGPLFYLLANNNLRDVKLLRTVQCGKGNKLYVAHDVVLSCPNMHVMQPLVYPSPVATLWYAVAPDTILANAFDDKMPLKVLVEGLWVEDVPDKAVLRALGA